MKDLTKDKELNAWALGCLQSLAKAERKDRTKLIRRYRKEIVTKVIETEIKLNKKSS